LKLETVLGFLDDLERCSNEGAALSITFLKDGSGYIETQGYPNRTLFGFNNVGSLGMHMDSFYQHINQEMRKMLKEREKAEKKTKIRL
jgi:hypothetical protein